MELYQFSFVSDSADAQPETIFALVAYPEHVNKQDMHEQIEDAISSYVDYVEEYTNRQMVDEVLNSFGLNYEIIEPKIYFI